MECDMPNWVTNVIELQGSPGAIAKAKALILNSNCAVDFEVAVPMPPELKESVRGYTIWDAIFAPVIQPLYHAKYMPEKEQADVLTALTMLEREDMDRLKRAAKEAMTASAHFSKWNVMQLDSVDAAIKDLIETAFRTQGERLRSLIAGERNLRQLGHADWYSWANARWGCKWNVADSEARVDEWQSEDGETASLSLKFDTAWAPPEPWMETVLGNFADGDLEVSGWSHDEGHCFWSRLSSTGYETFQCDSGDLHKEAYRQCYGSELNEDDEETEES
jgi:hypothetical protein